MIVKSNFRKLRKIMPFTASSCTASCRTFTPPNPCASGQQPVSPCRRLPRKSCLQPWQTLWSPTASTRQRARRLTTLSVPWCRLISITTELRLLLARLMVSSNTCPLTWKTKLLTFWRAQHSCRICQWTMSSVSGASVSNWETCQLEQCGSPTKSVLAARLTLLLLKTHNLLPKVLSTGTLPVVFTETCLKQARQARWRVPRSPCA